MVGPHGNSELPKKFPDPPTSCSCLRLTVPSSWSVEDFHLQLLAHAGRTFETLLSELLSTNGFSMPRKRNPFALRRRRAPSQSLS